MTVLPRRALLAVAAVLDVALLARGGPLPAKVLAARHAMAPRRFEPLLQALVRAGVLKSSRGPRGGYELARERRRISLGDVVRAVAGVRDARPEGAGSKLAEAVILPAVAAAADALLSELDRVTMDHLCARAARLGGDGAGPADDFAI